MVQSSFHSRWFTFKHTKLSSQAIRDYSKVKNNANIYAPVFKTK